MTLKPVIERVIHGTAPTRAPLFRLLLISSSLPPKSVDYSRFPDIRYAADHHPIANGLKFRIYLIAYMIDKLINLNMFIWHSSQITLFSQPLSYIACIIGSFWH